MFRAFLPLLALACLVIGCASDPRSPTADSRPHEAETGTPPSEAAHAAAPRIVTLEVGGMTCQGCVARVSESLAGVAGVHKVQVSLDQQTARVWADPDIADTTLTAAVRRAGPEFLGLVRSR